MPILMNKGADPRQAAWIFYSDRECIDTLGSSIAEGRFDSGSLSCDPDEMASAKKASSEIAVYLDVSMVVPEDFDLAGARGEVVERARAALERAQQQEDEQDGGEVEPEQDPFDYEPVPAPEGLRVRVGTTTLQAARDYILPGSEGEGHDETALPDLQMLGQLVDFMRDSAAGLPAAAIWHVDEQGILRMACAKKVKAMAGNTLSVKL